MLVCLNSEVYFADIEQCYRRRMDERLAVFRKVATLGITDQIPSESKHESSYQLSKVESRKNTKDTLLLKSAKSFTFEKT